MFITIPTSNQSKYVSNYLNHVHYRVQRKVVISSLHVYHKLGIENINTHRALFKIVKLSKL